MIMISGCLGGTINQRLFPPSPGFDLGVVTQVQNFTPTKQKKIETEQKSPSSDILWEEKTDDDLTRCILYVHMMWFYEKWYYLMTGTINEPCPKMLDQLRQTR